MIKCNTCGGTYERKTPDGYDYYHQCPPLAPHELQALIDAGRSPLTATQQAMYDAAVRADAAGPLLAAESSQTLRVLEAIVVPRPMERNENVTARRADAGGASIKAEGQGITTLAPPAK